MIVVDASAVVELLLRDPGLAPRLDEALLSGTALHAPHLIDIEVAHALRRYVLTSAATTERMSAALAWYRDLRLMRHPHSPYLPRVWDLRNELTAYDACYVALAEALDAPLVTCDARLAGTRGHTARIDLIE